MKKKKDETLEFVAKASEACDPDPAHSRVVTGLALALFDGLQTFHGYGPRERKILEIAGTLHDIGWSRAVSGKHHKLSRDMILALDMPGFDEHDRFLCALVARYHTKALPDASRHRKYSSLDREGRQAVGWLAGILRVADGLDCDHKGVVSGLTCSVGSEKITIRLRAERACRKEIERARKKEELLAEMSGRKIAYRC